MEVPLAGLAAGVAQTVVGYPFDVVKFRLQNQRQVFPLPLGTYVRGCRYPLLGSMGYNACIFPLYTSAKRRTHSALLAGGLTGLAVSPFVFVQSAASIRKNLDRQKGLTWSNFVGPRRAKGFPTSCARETLAMAVYFSSYQTGKQHWPPVVAGGAAGLCNWTCTYPLDVIRNRQIAQRCTWREAGAQGCFWRGFSVCAVRAVLVNAVLFGTYEHVKKWASRRRRGNAPL